MRRALAAIAVLLLVVAAGYWLLVRDSTVTARVHVPELTARIGSDSDAVGVSSSGEIVPFMPVPEDPPLPTLPLDAVPKSGHLAGPVLEQARVLGAAPAALRPFVERSYYGESGVDVDLTSGIELRFGDASQAALKWKAAAAILADPTITALDYVDLHAPGRPTWKGEGHSLPPAP
ncbi:MAG: cell division protein FtsQ/DivIB [Solirubrobacterales bacterium]